MAERSDDFIVVCIHDAAGFAREVGPILLEMVEITSPDHWEFIRPGTVMAYYRIKGKAKKGAADLRFSFESLQSRDARYQRIGIGLAEGRLIADIDFWGKVKTTPLGSIVGKAIEDARQKCRAK